MGMIETREGQVMTDPTTGRTFRVRFRADVRRLPRIRTQDGHDIFQNPNHPGRHILEQAVMALNGFTLAQSQVALQEMTGRADAAKSSFEITRQIPKMPDWIRVRGEEIQLFETHPFEAVSRIASSHSARIAANMVFGQELPTEATNTLRTRERLGATLPVTATREQIRNRRMLVRFIETADQPDKALRVVTDVQRAMHGLAIDKPVVGFAPGDAGHNAVRMLWPIRSLGIALKLTTAAAANVWEVFGTPATFLGQPRIASAFLRTWGDLMLRGPKALRTEAARFQAMGDVVDPIIPRFRSLSARSRGPGMKALDLAVNVEHLAFPMAGANWVADIIVARAGEGVIESFRDRQGRMSQRSRSRWMETLRQLDFPDSIAQRIVDGQASRDQEVSFLRRLRSYTMGVRQSKAEQGFLQQLRVLRGFVPFQGYASNNYRVWGRMLGDYTANFGQADNAARRRMLARHVRNKFAIAAGVTATYLAMDYGVHLWKAFAGEDEEAVVLNMLEKLRQYALFSELGVPFAAPVLQSVQDDDSLTFRDLLNATIPGSIANLGIDFWNHEGAFNNRTDRWNIGAKLWEALVSFTPLLTKVRRVTGDPELALAIRRRFEVVPFDGDGSTAKYNEFHNKMRQAMTKLREIGDNPDSDEWGEIEDVLLDALDADKKPGEDLTHKERRQRVASSLNSRKLLHGLSEDEKNSLLNRIGAQLYGRLEMHDEFVEDLRKWAQRQ
jgi:hypothetical protein